MSKYIMLDDVIHNLNMEVTGRIEYTETMKANLFFAIDKIPTLEVSEDAISREYLEEQYWQTLIPKELINTDIELGINIGIAKMHENIKNAPSVIPQAEEGEWKWETNDVCDNCGYKIPHLERIVGETVLMDSKDWNFCPNCGSRR